MYNIYKTEQIFYLLNEVNMKTGMLWFDNDPKTSLENKIIKAARYYQNKYGESPNLCFVHPSMLSNNHDILQGLEIRSSTKVLPNHLWLGINKKAAVAAVYSS